MSTPLVEYPGNGTTTQFDVTFPYLRKEHIKVHVDGNPVGFSWLTQARIQTSTAPASGKKLSIFRETPEEPIHVIQNNRPTPAVHYNELVKQAIYFSEEKAFVTYRDSALAAAAAIAASAAAEADRVEVLGYRNEVEADRAEVETNRASVAADRAVVATDKGVVATDKGIVATDKERAKKWATEAYNVPVEPGLYSAKHWSDRAFWWGNQEANVEVTPGSGLYSAKHWAMQAQAISSGGYVAAVNAAAEVTSMSGGDWVSIVRGTTLYKIKYESMQTVFQPFIPKMRGILEFGKEVPNSNVGTGIDFHASILSSGNDYDARVYRSNGTNGQFTIENAGNGGTSIADRGTGGMIIQSLFGDITLRPDNGGGKKVVVENGFADSTNRLLNQAGGVIVTGFGFKVHQPAGMAGGALTLNPYHGQMQYLTNTAGSLVCTLPAVNCSMYLRLYLQGGTATFVANTGASVGVGGIILTGDPIVSGGLYTIYVTAGYEGHIHAVRAG